MTAPVAAGTRIPWEAVPEHVRGEVEASLGSPVVSARTQVGGFSPGAAVRVVCADGSRAFVKACGSDLNPDTPDLNRAEIWALELLPPSVPHARRSRRTTTGSGSSWSSRTSMAGDRLCRGQSRTWRGSRRRSSR